MSIWIFVRWLHANARAAATGQVTRTFPTFLHDQLAAIDARPGECERQQHQLRTFIQDVRQTLERSWTTQFVAAMERDIAMLQRRFALRIAAQPPTPGDRAALKGTVLVTFPNAQLNTRLPFAFHAPHPPT